MATTLTPKQAAFCREYITSASATQAAKDAGYSESYARQQARQLLDKPEILERIRELQDKAATKAVVTVEDVLRGLKHEAATAESDTARVNAWAHLGKHLGMFAEKQEHSGELAIRIIRE